MGFGGTLSFKVKPYLSVLVHADAMMGTYKVDDTKLSLNTDNIGGGLSLRVLNITLSKDEFPKRGSVDLYAMVTTSFGNIDWKQTSSAIGFKWTISDRLSPTLGLGYRYSHSRTDGIPHFSGMYAAFGIKF